MKTQKRKYNPHNLSKVECRKRRALRHQHQGKVERSLLKEYREELR